MSFYKLKKYLWAQFTFPPITFFGVDQAPNQRLFFPVYGPFSSSRAFFYNSGTLHFRPSDRALFYRSCLHLISLSVFYRSCLHLISLSPGKCGGKRLWRDSTLDFIYLFILGRIGYNHRAAQSAQTGWISGSALTEGLSGHRL